MTPQQHLHLVANLARLGYESSVVARFELEAGRDPVAWLRQAIGELRDAVSAAEEFAKAAEKKGCGR